MATPIREWPLPFFLLLCIGLAVALALAGNYVPGSPLQKVRTDLQDANARLKPLNDEVVALRVYKQRKAELQSEMEALEKQLATLQTIVPEDKQTDQFILMVQNAAATSGVRIRHLTAKPVVPAEFHYEMPFEVEADGPYYSVLDFFAKLGQLSRIINVKDLKLTGVTGPGSASTQYKLGPGTTVTGTFMIATFFTQGAEQPPAAPAPTAGKR